LILTSANAAHALSDAYYSQGLYMDFKIAEDDQSIKQSLVGLFSKLVKLVSEDDESSFSINLDYFFKSE
jgi:hypothetical protein